MKWGYHHLRKHPYVYIFLGESSKTISIHHILEPRFHLQSMHMCLGFLVMQSHLQNSCLHEPNPATTQACERNLGFRQGADRPIKDLLHLYTLIIIELGNHIFFSRRSLSNPQVYKALMTQFLLRPEGCFDAGYASCTGSSILIVATTLGGKLVGAD